jgi:hypothetical protein
MVTVGRTIAHILIGTDLPSFSRTDKIGRLHNYYYDKFDRLGALKGITTRQR